MMFAQRFRAQPGENPQEGQNCHGVGDGQHYDGDIGTEEMRRFSVGCGGFFGWRAEQGTYTQVQQKATAEDAQPEGIINEKIGEGGQT